MIHNFSQHCSIYYATILSAIKVLNIVVTETRLIDHKDK